MLITSNQLNDKKQRDAARQFTRARANARTHQGAKNLTNACFPLPSTALSNVLSVARKADASAEPIASAKTASKAATQRRTDAMIGFARVVWRDRRSSRCRADLRVRVTGSVSSAVRTKVKFGNLDWIGSHLVFGV